MPITRKQISAAASTSNPPLNKNLSKSVSASNTKYNSVSKVSIPVSDDDLFEQSAIQVQVSSASRQTRTINHQIPTEIRKRLHNDFTAAAASNYNNEDETENIERNYIRNNNQIVTLSDNVKVNKNTAKSSLTSRTLVKRSFSSFNNKGPVVLSSPKEMPVAVDVDLNISNLDLIFEVPASPSPPRIINPIGNTSTNTNTTYNISVSTPNKTFANRLVGLSGASASPSKTGGSNQIIAEIRRTPLTMAEKKRRQALNSVALDKTSGTNIVMLKGLDVKKEPLNENGIKAKQTEKEKDTDEKNVKVSESELDLDSDSVINRRKSRSKSSKPTNNLIIIDENDVNIEDDTKDIETKNLILEVENCCDNFMDNNINNENKDTYTKKNKNIQISTNTKSNSRLLNNTTTSTSTQTCTNTKTKRFIRNDSTTESAPPDLIETLTSKSSKQPNPQQVIKNTFSSLKITDTENISLVIEVPPPPKLEDLESLDPELYVKLKSGSLKDDPNVPFISESDRLDIENFLESFTSPELTKNLLPVAIIGEGTFSTVYKVIDKNFYACDNGGWLEYSRQNPLDWLRLWRWIYEGERNNNNNNNNDNNNNNNNNNNNFVLYRDGKRCIDRNGKSLNTVNKKSLDFKDKDRLYSLLRRYLLEWAMCSLDSLLPHATEPSESVLTSITPRALQSAMLRFRPHFIALKRINSTSSPQRILDEMSFLKYLGGKNNVVPIINGIRCEDQVLVTFPYFYSEEFREFLSNTASLSIRSIACYMKALFIALAHLHCHNVIHRDVKPSNFLYAPENGGRGVLLDFGLAQKESRNTSGKNTNIPNNISNTKVLNQITPAQRNVQINHRNNEKERKKIQAVNQILNALNSGVINVNGIDGLDNGEKCERLNQLVVQLGPGYFNNDPRAGMKASRAGTRGFRAPEVLFKSSHQTTALDIWSAGVILLTLLTRRYPFFQSSDDLDAIVEIANIFGNEQMTGAAKIYGRKWRCIVPSVPEKHVGWAELCEKLNLPGFNGEKIPKECLDLLGECLNLDSGQRITARVALKHSFIQKYAH